MQRQRLDALVDKAVQDVDAFRPWMPRRAGLNPVMLLPAVNDRWNLDADMERLLAPHREQNAQAKISINDDNVVSYRPDRPVGTGVYRFPVGLSHEQFYFEVEVLSIIKGGQIVVGLIPFGGRYLASTPVGATENSIGYNLNGGLLLLSAKAASNFGPSCENRDVVGCGIHFTPRPGSKNATVFFTHNGKEIGSRDLAFSGERLLPAVSLNHPGERVRFNLRARWPPLRDEDEEEMQCDHFEDSWERLNDVYLNGDTIEYAGTGSSIRDVGFAQAAKPLSPENHYFELEILEPGENCYVAIGVTHKNYSSKQHPGWNKGSVAYHADDGEIFVGNGSGEEHGPVCKKGDRMGCGILFPIDYEEARLASFLEDTATNSPQQSPVRRPPGLGRLLRHRRGDNQRYRRHRQMMAPGGPLIPELWSMPNVELDDYVPQEQLDCGIKVKVFFTKNGEFVCDKEMSLPSEGFFPTVGLLSRGEKVRVDLQPLSG